MIFTGLNPFALGRNSQVPPMMEIDRVHDQLGCPAKAGTRPRTDAHAAISSTYVRDVRPRPRGPTA